jgi:predicted AAA+ superfamily ATPase
MTNNASQLATPFHERWIGKRFQDLLEAFPVVVVTGARQTGKTTLVRESPASTAWNYLSFDDPEVRRQAAAFAPALWEGSREIVLDEVQRAPEVLSAVKLAVDADRSRRFVLTGSANPLLMKSVGESLAGRAAYLVLRPLTLGEWERDAEPSLILRNLLERPEEAPWGASAPGGSALSTAAPGAAEVSPWSVVARGLMPALLGPAGNEAQAWWSGYVATYLDRDLRQLSQVDSLQSFHRVMQVLALRAGGMLNESEVARDCGVSAATVGRWVDLLQTGYLTCRLPAYAGNRTTRLMKMPKIHWLDPALGAFLAGLYSADAAAASREAGGLFEGLVCHHVRVLADLLTPPAELMHWRTYRGDEVDLVVEHGRRVLAIAAKATRHPTAEDVRGLRAFLRGSPQAAGLLVHGGSERRQMDRRIWAAPWTDLARGR